MLASMRPFTACTTQPGYRRQKDAYHSSSATAHNSRPQQQLCLSAGAVQSNASAAPTTTPTITIEIVAGKESAQAGSLTCESGDILRSALLANKVDLYTTWGKIMGCGGGGQCGTCVIEVLEGGELMSKRNKTETKKLGNKPETFRLACQSNVGDGSNSGSMKVRVKP